MMTFKMNLVTQVVVWYRDFVLELNELLELEDVIGDGIR